MEEKKSQATPKIDTNADVINQYTGEKWYYTDIVKDHFFNPRNLMLDDPDESQYNAMGMVGSPACILPSTLVVSNPSFKAIDSIGVGEKVLSHDSLYHPVVRVFKAKYKKMHLVKIRNYLGETIATEDHLFYVKQIPKTWTFRYNSYKRKIPSVWVHAGDIRRGDIALYPLPTVVRPSDEIIFVQERTVGDFISKSIPERLKVSPELLELFGYFIAEGSTKKTEVHFTFGGKEMHLALRAQTIVENLFGLKTAIRRRPEQHRIDVCVYSVHLARNFRTLFGVSAATKRIPSNLLLIDPVLQGSLLKGLWLGDGHFAFWRSQPRAGFTTVSTALFHQVVFLLLRQRIIPSTLYEKAKEIRGVRHQSVHRIHVGDMSSLEKLGDILGISFQRDSKKRHEVRVWFEDNYVCIPIKNVERVPYNGGRLYNFEVADSHTYATDSFLIHNCGDMMRMWLKIDPEGERIKEMKWRTFGCGSAIAATSMFSVMVTENGGMTLADALQIKPQHIMERLGGLPNRKIHCSVLADKAFRKAANEYLRHTGQYDRVIIEGAKVIDAKLNITDKDIEEAVLEGAMDLESVQKKLKVGVGSPEIITEVEQLIRFYKEKYYG